MVDGPSTLELLFIGDIKSSIFSGYRTLDKIFDFKTTKITIPNGFFGTYKEKKMIEFQLLFKEDENKKIIIQPKSFYFYIFVGKNKAYCFIDHDSENLFDICCLDEKVGVYYKDMELNEFNYLEDDTRSRIILINTPSKVKINNDKKIYTFIPYDLPEDNSIQISFFDSTGSNYSVKVISYEEISEELSIVKYLREKESNIKEFYKELEDLIKKKLDDVEILNTLVAGKNLIKINNNFSTRKDILNKALADDELYDLFYKYILWVICDLKYFTNNKEVKKGEKKQEKKEETITKELEDIIEINLPINIIFKYINKIYEKYKNDKDLLNYQRVLLFYSNTIFFIKIDNEIEYDKRKLEYVIKKNIEKNSVFDLSFKFIENFIDNLNSKSHLFYPLLLLDSGLYYKEGKTIYGFDFQKCDKIKEHLKDLLPEVFFIYNSDSIDNEKGFIYKGTKTIFLNKSTVLSGYIDNPQKEDLNTKIVKHYAMRISKCLMHEIFEHNKLLYQYKNGIGSPRYFYDKDKKFITMIPKAQKYKVYQNESNFFINEKEYLGESGNFFEYFFGFYKDELIIDFLYDIPEIGKLIDNVKYFTCEKLDFLKDYIIYKYLLKENKIEFHEKENTNIEEDINEMYQLSKYYNINIDEQKVQKKESKPDIKRKDESSQFLFLDIDEKVVKDYSYYLKKMEEAKTKNESRRYAKELLFHHLKKE